MKTSISMRALRATLAGLVAGTALLTACGGGGGTSDDTAGTGFTQGAITGLGSIIVNGVRFDDRRAQIVDEDDRGRDRAELRLGVMVEVESDRARIASAGGGQPTATATRIRMGSELVGPVQSVDVAAGTLRMLDQTVVIDGQTLFDDSLVGGLAVISPDMLLEVHAQFDAATGRYLATRVEHEDSASVYKLRGLVGAFDPSGKTFRIGDAVIDFSKVDPVTLPNNLADGVRVRVRLETARNAANQWVAVSVRTGVRKVEDHDEAKLRGLITEVTGTLKFNVNGLPVDATAAELPDGADGLVVGARVEVEGKVVAGVLVASKVELEDRHRDEDRHGIELHDRIVAIDPVVKTFTLERGAVVSYAGTVEYRDGTEASLAVGRRVEVKGVRAADGVTIRATRIEFES